MSPILAEVIGLLGQLWLGGRMPVTRWKSNTYSSWSLPFIHQQGQRSNHSHDNLPTRHPLYHTHTLSLRERYFGTPAAGISAKSARSECADGRCDSDGRIKTQFWIIYCSLVQKSFFFPCLIVHYHISHPTNSHYSLSLSLSQFSSHSPALPSFPVAQPFISQ